MMRSINSKNRRNAECGTGAMFRVIALTLAAACAGLQAQDAPAVLAATGVSAGLAVVVGTTDGALEASLASPSLLVQGISTDAKAVGASRAKIAQLGKFPLANVSWVAGYKKLPYAPILANLVVADLDKLGGAAPTLEEIKRIVAYNGKAYVKQGGAWKVVAHPMPGNVDEWPYQFYDAYRRPVSKDMRAGLWSGLKWIAGPRKKGSDVGLRIENGTMFTLRTAFPITDKERNNTNLPQVSQWILVARDAFSGLLLWHTPITKIEGGRTASKTTAVNFVAHGGKVFGYPPAGYLTAWDGRTGKVVRTYDQTVKIDTTANGAKYELASHAAGLATIFFHQGKMFQSYKNHLWALDEATGKVLWHHQEAADSNWVWQPVPGDDGDIYSAITAQGPEGGFKDNVDGHLAFMKGLVRLRSSDGSVVWRNEVEFEGTMGQFLGGPGAGVVPALIHVPKNFPSFKAAWDGLGIWVYSMADGKRLWRTALQLNWTSATTAILDGNVNVMDAYRHLIYEPLTGKPVSLMSLSSENEDNPGCMSISMTPRFYFRGPRINERPKVLPPAGGKSTYLDAHLPMMFRPMCGEVTSPAYGQLYSPGTQCGCNWYLPGDLAVYNAETTQPWQDSKRKISGDDGLGAAKVAGKVEAPASGALSLDWGMAVDIQHGTKGTRWEKSSMPQKSLSKSWYTTAFATESVMAGDLSIRSVVQQNRIEALRGSEVVWTFLAGGRVSVAPVVAGNLIVFGCHDGWVYALKAQDGTLAWRYFAAPAERHMVAYGQVESAWPLFGVLLQGGKICYLAGRNSGIDDGMAAGALNPATGEPQWRIRIARYDAGKYLHSMNSPLGSIDGKVAFLGPGINPSNPQNIVVEADSKPSASAGQVPAETTTLKQEVLARIKRQVTKGTHVYDIAGRAAAIRGSEQATTDGLGKMLPRGKYFIFESDSASAEPMLLYNR